MFGFLIAVGAGFLVPHLVDPLARPVAAQLRKFIPVQDAELSVIAALLAVLGATLIATIIDSGSPVGLSLGVLLGYFLPRILAAANKSSG